MMIMMILWKETNNHVDHLIEREEKKTDRLEDWETCR
jgi:hypothetical protein